MSKINKIPFWPSVLALAGVVVLCGLGAWQVQRLHWKEELLAAMAQAETADPARLLTFHEAQAYARVTVTGHYTTKNFMIGPRTHDGHPGYHIHTPLVLDNGEAVLVNRGWVDLADTKTGAIPDSRVHVTGMLRPVPRQNMFVPQNVPGVWYRVDLPAMAQEAGLESLSPLVLYAESERGVASSPVTDDLRWNPPNNHLQYALFWFAMAGVLIVIYVLRFLKR